MARRLHNGMMMLDEEKYIRNRLKPAADSSDFTAVGGNTPAHRLPREPRANGSSISYYEAVRGLLRWKKAIATSVLSVMLATAVIVLFTPNQYRSTATILPTDKPDRLAELKGLIDPAGALPDDNNSSQLFPFVLASRLVAEALLAKTYSFSHEGRVMTTTLPEYFRQNNRDLLQRRLAGITSVRVDKKTGVIELAVETTLPELSQAVAREYLAQLENYNLYQRRSRAGENAGYLSNQLVLAKQELEQAEDDLQAFRQVNSDWPVSSDAELVKELGRLQRTADVRSQTYLYLSQQLAAAKLEAQKDIPVVGILDQPSLPIVKSRPQRTLIVLLAGFVTFMAAVFAVVVATALAARRAAETASYRALRHEMAQSFPRTTRMLRIISRRREEPVGVA